MSWSGNIPGMFPPPTLCLGSQPVPALCCLVLPAAWFLPVSTTQADGPHGDSLFSGAAAAPATATTPIDPESPCASIRAVGDRLGAVHRAGTDIGSGCLGCLGLPGLYF